MIGVKRKNGGGEVKMLGNKDKGNMVRKGEIKKRKKKIRERKKWRVMEVREENGKDKMEIEVVENK